MYSYECRMLLLNESYCCNSNYNNTVTVVIVAKIIMIVTRVLQVRTVIMILPVSAILVKAIIKSGLFYFYRNTMRRNINYGYLSFLINGIACRYLHTHTCIYLPFGKWPTVCSAQTRNWLLVFVRVYVQRLQITDCF